MEMTLNANFLAIENDSLELINGGALTWATLASALGGLYSALVGMGAIGWLGTTAVGICTAPLVAGTATVIGIACAIYGITVIFY